MAHQFMIQWLNSCKETVQRQSGERLMLLQQSISDSEETRSLAIERTNRKPEAAAAAASSKFFSYEQSIAENPCRAFAKKCMPR